MFRPLRIVLLSGLALALAAGLGWVAYAHLAAPRPQRTVAMPPDDASPREVVAAFLDALDAHDCDTATSLATARARDSAASAGHPLGHPPYDGCPSEAE